VNLRLMFDALFTPEAGCGYPANRSEPQKQGRILLAQISQVTHRPMTEILLSLPNEVIRPVLNFPAFRPVLEQAAVVNTGFHSALEKLS
jgi:hypothetical protein